MTGGTRARRWTAAGLLAVSVISVGGLFLWLVLDEGGAAPPGFDTPKYVWRANLVAGQGLDALEGSSPFREHPDRPGYPVLAAVVRATTGIDAFALGFVLPAMAGIVVGLAAGVLAIRVLGEPEWAFPVYAFLVGASLNVVLTASGLIDNLLLDAVVLAAAATALIASEGRPTIVATFVLMAGATFIHWPLTATFLAVLGAVALATLPGSLRGRTPGRPLRGTPAARLGAVVIGSAAILAAGIGVLGVPVQGPVTKRPAFVRKLGRFVPRFRVAVIGPAAALGVAALALPPLPLRRRGLVLALVWAAGAALTVPLLLVADVAVPAHRFLGFALGIPILVAAAVAGAGRLLTRIPHRLLGTAAVAVLVVGAVAGAGWLDRGVWLDRARVKFPLDGVVQSGHAGRYLSAVGNRSPVIFPITPRIGVAHLAQSATVAFGVIRSALPADQIPLAHVYLGEPGELLAGRPTLRPGSPGFNEVSLAHWQVVRPLLDEGPVVVRLSAFNRDPAEVGAVDGRPVGAGVTVLRGPVPPGHIPAPRAPAPPSPGALVLRLAAVLALLWAVGTGWGVTLLPGWLARIALAPAIGIAVLVVAGTLAGRLSLDGPGARIWLAVLVAGAGWVVPGVRAVRARRAA